MMSTFMEIFTLVTGVIYVVLEIRQKNLMWIVGMATSLAAMYMFFTEGLYASFGLNCYYFAVSVWGLWQWRRDGRRLAVSRGTGADGDEGLDGRGASRDVDGGNEAAVGSVECDGKKAGGDVVHLNRMGWRTAVALCVVLVAGVLLLRVGLNFLRDSMSGLDAAVAVLSAVATFMLAKSYIYQWLVWIVADLMSTVLCAMSGMYWMTALYAVYALSAAYGYVYWRRHGVYIEDQ